MAKPIGGQARRDEVTSRASWKGVWTANVCRCGEFWLRKLTNES